MELSLEPMTACPPVFPPMGMRRRTAQSGDGATGRRFRSLPAPPCSSRSRKPVSHPTTGSPGRPYRVDGDLAGGQVALLAAIRGAGTAAVAAWSAVTDVASWQETSETLRMREYIDVVCRDGDYTECSPLALADRLTVPVLLIQATETRGFPRTRVSGCVMPRRKAARVDSNYCLASGTTVSDRATPERSTRLHPSFGRSCPVSALTLAAGIRRGMAEAGDNEKRGRGVKTATLWFGDRCVSAT